ncbi:MAG: hypothetical protein WC777_01620 [Candidatus Gracilibacteria bacterium]
MKDVPLARKLDPDESPEELRKEEIRKPLRVLILKLVARLQGHIEIERKNPDSVSTADIAIQENKKFLVANTSRADFEALLPDLCQPMSAQSYFVILLTHLKNFLPSQAYPVLERIAENQGSQTLRAYQAAHQSQIMQATGLACEALEDPKTKALAILREKVKALPSADYYIVRLEHSKRSGKLMYSKIQAVPIEDPRYQNASVETLEKWVKQGKVLMHVFGNAAIWLAVRPEIFDAYDISGTKKTSR